MKNKKKVLLSSVLVIALCLSLIAGSTFALFTSESHVNIAVTSGKVNVDAEIKNPKIYSATVESKDEQDTAYEVAGEITSGNHAATYYYEPLTVTTDSDTGNFNGVFTNTGEATYTATTNKLDLDRVTPGDRIDFDVEIANNSNVNIQYRVIVTVNSGLKIFNKMKVSIDGVLLTGVSRTGNWKNLEVNGTIPSIPVKIYLPIDLDGEEYMNQSTSMTVSVEAVQGNAKTTNEILTTAIETEPTATTVANSKTTAENTQISDNDNLVTVVLPKDTVLTSETDTSLMVKVTPQETQGNIAVLNNNPAKASASYDVSVLKIVTEMVGEETTTTTSDAISHDNEEKIRVTMFVGTGLMGVELYHYDDATNKTTQITDFDYNSESGYITFETTSFSEYTVVYNANYAYETDKGIVVLDATEATGVYTNKDGDKVNVSVDESGNVTTVSGNYVLISGTKDGVVYETLVDAFDAAEIGDKILLNVNLPVISNNEESPVFAKNTMLTVGQGNKATLDWYGHTKGGVTYFDGKASDDIVYRVYSDGDVYLQSASYYEGSTFTVKEYVDGIDFNAFSFNETIERVIFTKDLKDAMKIFENNATVKSVDFGNMTKVPNRMFYKIKGISDFVVPEGITTLEVGAFQQSAIESLSLPASLNYAAKQSIAGCVDLTTIIFNGGNNDALTLGDYLSRGCPNLKTVELHREDVTFEGQMTFTNTESGSSENVTVYVVNETVKERIQAVPNMLNLTVKEIISVSNAEELKNAVKNAASNDMIALSSDIVISDAWDERKGGRTSVPVIIDGLGHTIKFTGDISDGGNYHSVFRFEGDATVKNLTFDLSEVPEGNGNRVRAISAKANLTVENCKFIGTTSRSNSRAIIFGEGQSSSQVNASVSIKNSKFVNWTRGVSDNENAKDFKIVVIDGNTFTNANVGVSAYEKITFVNNSMSGCYVQITSYSAADTAQVEATGNRLDNNYAEDNWVGYFDAEKVIAQEEITVYTVENL